ncbi:MAG: calcium/sodium antiporter [Marinobacter sp.]|uniref:calcium/sodium antiporter n=1 Tax=Marinobacter sp. TaxID=50741 RepID=UPI00299D71CF|nr:calcium/sodium antiporter [Marinobacter sp.]MDX1633856.1 calcium/sodium antiporter [Marinobacter sp.]
MLFLLYLVALVIGLAALTWSADRFINGAAGLASGLHLPPMVAGLLLVAFGTSAPEIMVSVLAALTGEPELAVGNALGSNIANVGLVLGLTTLIAPLPLQRSVLFRELPILLAATAIAWLMIWDRELSPLDGVLFLLMLVAAMGYLMWRAKSGKGPASLEVPDVDASLSLGRALWQFSTGLLILVASARLLVWAASELALLLGVEPMIVGLTMVALGTSLPELAASLTAALKGHHEMALGNIVGSNLFNLLAVLAMPALLSPLALGRDSVLRDYGTMAGLTLLLAAFAYGMQRKGKLARLEGGILLAIYLGYIGWLAVTAR